MIRLIITVISSITRSAAVNETLKECLVTELRLIKICRAENIIVGESAKFPKAVYFLPMSYYFVIALT